MTSESSPQYGWPPADRDEPKEEAHHQRGFGLFEAPPAPEEFPAFSPLTAPMDDFPSDNGSRSSSFGGFPIDDSALTDPYVPDPAALPIPGVRHDPEPAPSHVWGSLADHPVPPPPPPFDPLPAADSNSWSAFGAAPESRAVPATHWEPPAPTSDPMFSNAPRFENPPPPPPQAAPSEPMFSNPPLPPAASGSVRVSASVPPANRVGPEETGSQAPSRPQGRVYGSPVSPDAQQAAAEGAQAALPPMQAPPIPMQQPPMALQAPAADAPTARATARAAVNVSPPAPTEVPPQLPRSSTVYGSATASAAPAQQQGPRQGRQHAYGDLLGPGGGQGPEMPQHGVAPVVPAQRSAPGMMQGAPHQMQGQQQMPGGMQFPGATTYGGREQELIDDNKPERKGRIIVGVLVGCVALLAVAFGVLILVDKYFVGPTFAVGDCVKQGSGVALAVDCAEPGAFIVKSSVSSAAQCEDQTQPHVEQGSQILCLAPAQAPQVVPTPTASAGA